MTFDENPFGATAAPAAVAVEAPPWEAGTAPEAPQVSPEALSVTLKGGAGFEAPWIVVKGPNVAAVEAQLNAIAQSKLFALAAQAAEAWRAAAGDSVAAAPQTAPGGYQAKPQPPQSAAAAPSSAQLIPTNQSCPHGVLAYTSWQSKDKSRTFAAYKCPAKVANYRDPNSCDATVWADKV